MPSEATETVPVTEQEMQQPQVETGSYDLRSAMRVLVVLYRRVGSWSSRHNCCYTIRRPCWADVVLMHQVYRLEYIESGLFGVSRSWC